MKFKYLDKVMVTNGFYEGAKGIVIDVCLSQYLVRLDGPSPEHAEYFDKWFMDDSLEVIEE